MSSATLKHIAIEDKDLKAGTTIPNVTLTRYEHGEDVEIQLNTTNFEFRYRRLKIMGTRHQRQPLLHRYLESTKDFEETHTEKLTKLKTLLMRRASAITEMADLPDVNDRTGGVLSMLGEVAGLLVKEDGWLDEVNTLWAELDRTLPYGP